MTEIQKRALYVLVFHWPDHNRPIASNLLDGHYAGGLDGASPAAIADGMNLWRDVWKLGHPAFNARTVGRIMRYLVEAGFAARVFISGERNPRYVATAEGEAALKAANAHPTVWHQLAAPEFRKGKKWIRYEGRDGVLRLVYLIRSTRQIHVRFHNGSLAGWATGLTVNDLQLPAVLVDPVPAPVPIPPPLGSVDVE